jgi:hypothetical protein
MSDDILAAQAFLDEMTPILEKAERNEEQQRRCRGSAFHIADYAVRGYEVPLNRILGDLLAPRGPHGQREQFLQIFLELVAPDLLVGETHNWVVRLNHPTTAGRYVDLALFSKNEIAVYIESKPWAVEGDDQLEDYANDLLSLRHNHKRLLFLPGTALRKPQTLTQKTRDLLGKQFISVPFQYSDTEPSIVQWLELCALASEADIVRLFIRDLAEYLRSQFPSPEAKLMSNDPFVLEMLPRVRNSKSYMETVFRVAQLADNVKKTVTMEFLYKLDRQIKTTKPGWAVKNDFKTFNVGEQRFLFRKESWPEDWGICLEMWKPNFRDFCIGFRCPSEAKDRESFHAATDDNRAVIRNVLEKPLRDIGNIQKMLPIWPAWCWLPAPFQIWQDDAFLLVAELESMADGRTAPNTFADWFLSLANAAESKIDEMLNEHSHRTIA